MRDTLTPIYEKNEQKQKRSEVDRTLDEGLTFVKHIRGRITRYVEFGNKMREWCNQAGLPHCSAHGLRKAMSRRLASRSGPP